MSAWLPVFAALAGAIVGGTISVLATWLSGRTQLRLALLRTAEDRATWAANRRLEQLDSFHRAVETLKVAAQSHRIWWAWHVRQTENDTPQWVKDLGDTRWAFEQAMRDVQLAASLMDDDLLSGFAEILKIYWSQVMVGDDPTSGMVSIEGAVENYRKQIAERYRLVTRSRLQGADAIGGDGQQI
ncbi:MAG: hypothetical protein HY054_04280 [Proteobacteria bacterium]|nr:hypothetical protein [Pseudomonadota bacterium]